MADQHNIVFLKEGSGQPDQKLLSLSMKIAPVCLLSLDEEKMLFVSFKKVVLAEWSVWGPDWKGDRILYFYWDDMTIDYKLFFHVPLQ